MQIEMVLNHELSWQVMNWKRKENTFNETIAECFPCQHYGFLCIWNITCIVERINTFTERVNRFTLSIRQILQGFSQDLIYRDISPTSVVCTNTNIRTNNINVGLYVLKECLIMEHFE